MWYLSYYSNVEIFCLQQIKSWNHWLWTAALSGAPLSNILYSASIIGCVLANCATWHHLNTVRIILVCSVGLCPVVMLCAECLKLHMTVIFLLCLNRLCICYVSLQKATELKNKNKKEQSYPLLKWERFSVTLFKRVIHIPDCHSTQAAPSFIRFPSFIPGLSPPSVCQARTWPLTSGGLPILLLLTLSWLCHWPVLVNVSHFNNPLNKKNSGHTTHSKYLKMISMRPWMWKTSGLQESGL